MKTPTKGQQKNNEQHIKTNKETNTHTHTHTHIIKKTLKIKHQNNKRK